MRPQEIKLTFESLIALIQGRKLHVFNGKNHFIFLPPGDGVFITHDQLTQMRMQDQVGALNFLENIADYKQNI